MIWERKRNLKIHGCDRQPFPFEMQRLIEGGNLPRNTETRREQAKHDHHRFSDRHTLPLLLTASLSMPPAPSLYPCAHTLKQSGQRRIEL
jgi:hypothetical protein